MLILYPFAKYYQKGTRSMKAIVKKSLRLWIPILLASLLLALFSGSVFAENADPGDTWWSLNLETGILSVEENIPESCNWLGYYPPWYEWKDAITEVRISEGVRSLGDYAFAECYKLVRVILPDSLEEIGEHAFGDCVSLKELRIPKKVSVLGPASFVGSDSLERFLVDPSNPYYTADARGVLYKKDMSELVVCPNGFAGVLTVPDGVTTLGASCCRWCEELTGVSLPDSVTRIRSYAFEGCKALTHIKLPESVTMVEEAVFELCSSLKTADLANTDIESPHAIFSGCESLEKVIVSGDNPFFACDKQGALYDKAMKQIIQCPQGFEGRFNIPQGIESIGNGAFSGCGNLTEVVIPGSVSEICDFAFYYCPSLKRIVIPNSVKSMGVYIFQECESLVSVVFPASIAVIEDDIFSGCYSLEKVYFRGPAPEIDGWYFVSPSVIVYYVEGQEGWSAQAWEDYTTRTWSGYVATDVHEEDYYYEPVQWALEKGITTGVGKDFFRPENVCTRGQIVTFLWRAKGCPEPTTTNNLFTDISSEAYYYKAVLWAAEQGITRGVKADRFAPEQGCSRGQVVTFLWRAMGQQQAEGSELPFTDVEEAAYYSQAVLWAVEQGITTGKTTDRFAPEDLCTRGQIVTFLWRAKALVPNAYAPYAAVLRAIEEKGDAVDCRGLFYDLDGNGIEELLLTYKNYDKFGDHCSVYTIEDGEAVPMLEEHIFAYVIDGNRGNIGLAELDGQLHFYTCFVSYEMGHNETYQYIDRWGVKWKFYLPSEDGLSLGTEMDLDYIQGSTGEEWVFIEEECAFTINGEEKPFASFETWKEGVTILKEWNTHSGGYPLHDLLNTCTS